MVGEGFAVLIAIVSSALGGTAAATTRYLVHDADPITLAIFEVGNRHRVRSTNRVGARSENANPPGFTAYRNPWLLLLWRVFRAL